MGILAAILGQNNPVAQWTAANHGWLSNVGAGIASGPTLSDGLARAAQLGPAGQLIDQQYQKDQADKQARQDAINQSAKDLAKFPDLMQAVASGAVTPAVAYGEAWRRSTPGYGGSAAQPTTDIQNYEFGLSHPDFATQMTQRGGAAETALQPVWGTDGAGNPVLGQLNKAGEFVQTKLPPGLKAMGPGETAATKAGATVDAKTAAAARASLPGVEQAYAVTQKTLGALTADPSVMAGQKENFGKLGGIIPQQMLPSIVGTNRANFKNVVDQLSGQAFLNIRQALKGAGQVTDYEGQKGEIALSRMKAAADSGDEQAFMQAVADYQDAINNGIALLREQANGGYSAGQPAVTGAGSGDVESILKGYGL